MRTRRTFLNRTRSEVGVAGVGSDSVKAAEAFSVSFWGSLPVTLSSMDLITIYKKASLNNVC